MRTHARAVVIGGGVVGVSTLYHLAQERLERTAFSSSAGS